MKFIKPTDFKYRAEKGDLYLRVDFNVVTFSAQIAEDLNLKVNDTVAFGEDKGNLYLSKAISDKDGFKLRKSGEKGLCFSMKPFATWLLKRFGLDEVLKGSDFSCHKFPLEITDDEGIYLIVPPKKFSISDKASPNGVLQHA